MREAMNRRNQFIAYVGDPDVHDASIVSVSQAGQKVEVQLKSYAGRRFRITFSGARKVISENATDMIVYSLTEMASDSPYRKFVFVNSDEKNPARLEVEAQG